jgi:amino-acid N-acetyltransferase
LSDIAIRRAVVSDVKGIHKLLNFYGDQGFLLSRPLSELYDHLRDFFVLVQNHKVGVILGVCALGICWDDLAEIRSLAVAEGFQGKGFGAELVRKCIEEAKSLGLHRVFVLTYEEKFFAKEGFKRVEKSSLPHKIWADCLRCSKFPECDETAMILYL